MGRSGEGFAFEDAWKINSLFYFRIISTMLVIIVLRILFLSIEAAKTTVDRLEFLHLILDSLLLEMQGFRFFVFL